MDERRTWDTTRSVARGGVVVAGVVATFATIAEQGSYVLEHGISAWLDDGISGTDFLLLLVVVPLLVLLAVAVLVDGLEATLRDRKRFWANDAARVSLRREEGLKATPQRRGAWLWSRITRWL